MRKYGLTIDQLLSVDLVTADGELVTASADENADLFWGVRGRRRQLRHRHRVRVPAQPGRARPVLAGPVFWPMEESPRCCASTATGSPTCPDELMTMVVHRRAPPLPVIPRRARTASRSSRWSAATPDPRRGRREGRCGRSRRSARPCSTCARRSRSSTIRRCSTPPSPTAGGTTSAPATSPSSPTTSSTSPPTTRMRIRSPLTSVPDLADGRRGRSRRRRRDGLQRARRRPHVQHQRHAPTAERLRGGARVGPQLLVGPRAAPHRAST